MYFEAFVRRWVGWVVLLALMAGSALADGVVVIPIKGEISDAKFIFMRRALKTAEAQNATAVILDMDTGGGKLESAVSMQKALANTKSRTITYINPNSGSAGALIAVSTQEIYMSPISAIGAAAPVLAGGQDLPETIREKGVSYYSGYFRSAAERNGHNPAIAEAFINNKIGVTIGGEVVHKEGAVLTLSAQEATRVIDGKPILAAGIADSLEDLLEKADLKGKGPVTYVEPTHFEELAFWITALAPILLMGGMLGIWLEIKTPGFGLPGILAIVCFTIFFTGHYLAGLAGLEAPVLFFLGLLLILVEIIFFPGIFILAGFGVVLVIGSLLWAMIDRYPSQPLLPAADAFLGPVANLGIALIVAALVMAVLVKYLPKTRVYRSFVLDAEIPSGPAFVPQQNEFSGLAPGDTGVALSILRPSGRAEFGGEPRDVISTGTFIEAGARLRVVAVEGSRIIVQEVEKEA